MEIIGAQFYKLSGPDATSNYQISFMVDESQRKGILDLAGKIEKGKDLVLMIHIEDDDEDIKNLIGDSSEKMKEKLFKQIHAKINEISKEKNKDKEEIKKTLRALLKKKKYLTESTKELDENGLAAAIYYLTHYF